MTLTNVKVNMKLYLLLGPYAVLLVKADCTLEAAHRTEMEI